MRLILIAIITMLTDSLHAQMKLRGRIKGVEVQDTIQINIPFDAWYYKANNILVPTNSHGVFSIELDVSKPQNIFFIYRGLKLNLYAEPQKDLSITFEKDSLINTLTFEGALKQENHLRKDIGLTIPRIYYKNWYDSVSSPQQILTALRAYQSRSFKKLIQMKAQVSPAFKNITWKDIQYCLPGALWEIIWDKGVFSTSSPKLSEREGWIRALQQVYQEQPLSDKDAIDSYFYQLMVANYTRYLNVSALDKEALETLAERIFGKPFEEASHEVKAKGKRFWEYKTLNYGFNGLALEYAIASFIVNGISEGELGFLNEAYTDFKSRYPESRYRKYIDSVTAPYFGSVTAAMSENISFDSVGQVYESLDKVLERHKGKVVYIDLWGTWCGPCREEFNYNKDLKQYFKNKPVDFLYIAFENNKEPEKLWKETARFYGLEGRHILGNTELRSIIQKMYQSDGTLVFPSYILVDKDGKVSTLFAKRPSTKQVLYNQIEQLLN